MRVPAWGMLIVCAVAGAAASGIPAAASPISSPAASAAGRYDHVFVIVEENHGFSDIIGNPAAPNLNALASRYGLATSYFAVAHPSEPNYVGSSAAARSTWHPTTRTTSTG